jgi:hypothetical protein
VGGIGVPHAEPPLVPVALCESDPVSTTTRRSAALWLVGAALVGAAAAVLHVLRSDFGGGHASPGLAVSAYLVTGLAALMLYHGIVVAARAQDAAAPRAIEDEVEPWPRPGDPSDGTALDRDRVDPVDPVDPLDPLDHPDAATTPPAVETHEVYTFRRGKRIGHG